MKTGAGATALRYRTELIEGDSFIFTILFLKCFYISKSPKLSRNRNQPLIVRCEIFSDSATFWFQGGRRETP